MTDTHKRAARPVSPAARARRSSASARARAHRSGHDVPLSRFEVERVEVVDTVEPSYPPKMYICARGGVCRVSHLSKRVSAYERARARARAAAAAAACLILQHGGRVEGPLARRGVGTLVERRRDDARPAPH